MSANTFVSITMQQGAELEKRIRRLQTGSETAIRNTVSDFKSRAPGWVSKGVRQHYAVDTAGVKTATARVTDTGSSGNSLAGVKINYKGRTLTLTHFNMSPKQAPTAKQSKYVRIPGQKVSTGSPVAMVRPPKRYKVKATIIKGQRVEMSGNAFVANGLPWKRKEGAQRKSDVLHTLSVPQMISGKAKDTINQLINENMEKRLEHNINQVMK